MRTLTLPEIRGFGSITVGDDDGCVSFVVDGPEPWRVEIRDPREQAIWYAWITSTLDDAARDPRCFTAPSPVEVSHLSVTGPVRGRHPAGGLRCFVLPWRGGYPVDDDMKRPGVWLAARPRYNQPVGRSFFYEPTTFDALMDVHGIARRPPGTLAERYWHFASH